MILTAGGTNRDTNNRPTYVRESRARLGNIMERSKFDSRSDCTEVPSFYPLLVYIALALTWTSYTSNGDVYA